MDSTLQKNIWNTNWLLKYKKIAPSKVRLSIAVELIVYIQFGPFVLLMSLQKFEAIKEDQLKFRLTRNVFGFSPDRDVLKCIFRIYTYIWS